MRLEKLYSPGVLGTDQDPILGAIVEIACMALRMPIALVTLLDSDRQWFKASRGFDGIWSPREQAFCHYTILNDTPFIVSDTKIDDRFGGNLLVGNHPIRFYAGIPLEIEPGVRLGCLCVLDRTPRELDHDALEILKRLGQCASDRLRQSGNSRLIELLLRERPDQAMGGFHLINAAHAALSRHAFLLFYQPKFELRTRTRIGFEALLRWRNSDGSVLAPASFTEALDDPEFSRRIGSFVLAEAISQAKAWEQTGFDFGHIAINVSSNQFTASVGMLEFADEVLAATRSASLPPSKLHIEVTEGVLLSGRQNQVPRQLAQLRAAGFTVAFDDFGTGFASLIHLKELQYDQIKIDGSFVRGMINSTVDMAIVKAIVELAQDLGKGVVAESIETEAELAALIGMGCEYGQGYLLGRPAAPGDVKLQAKIKGKSYDDEADNASAGDRGASF
jgi:EAL domain-containing protein (putative c-di-GMP-specific phosphodiesterase class I)